MPVHLGAADYDLSPLRTGRGQMDAIVEAELGPVAGRRVLHLQCHFGKDSLVLAGRGAEVTGLDFSAPAVEAARSLALELDLTARFVQADLYGAPAAIPEPASYDLVFTTWGTIAWLPDVAGWARVVAISSALAERCTLPTPTRRRTCLTTWRAWMHRGARVGSRLTSRAHRW